MNRLVELKCPNCSSAMQVKDNCIECPYCGTQYISFFSGSIESDVASIRLDSLLDEIEKNKKDFLIINGKITSGNVDDIISGAGLKVALEELKKGNYYNAEQYAKKSSGIEAVRVTFLAQYNCKNESFLQEKCIWGSLKSSAIPSSLVKSTAYGGFYSSLLDYCRQRETAAQESNKLIMDYISKYLFLDSQIKAISGKEIYEALRHRANELCKKYPVFPEPWLAQKIFDKSAISKMICAFQKNSLPYEILLNWSNNHFVNTRLNLADDKFVYKTLFTSNEVDDIKTEISRRYPKYNPKNCACSIAAKQSAFSGNKSFPSSNVKKIFDQFVVYPKRLNTIAEECYNGFFNIAKEFWEKNGSSGCDVAAGSKYVSNDSWKYHVYWFPTKYSNTERSWYVNYGLSHNKRLSVDDREALVELLYEMFASRDHNLLSYEITVEDYNVNLAPKSIIPKKRTVAQYIKITAYW